MCDDQDRDEEWRFIIHFKADVCQRQLSLSDSVIKDANARYLDHLPTAVYALDYQVAVFMWNRFYLFKLNEKAFSYSGHNTIPAHYRQIEQYFNCQWCPDMPGLFDFVSVDLIQPLLSSDVFSSRKCLPKLICKSILIESFLEKRIPNLVMPFVIE